MLLGWNRSTVLVGASRLVRVTRVPVNVIISEAFARLVSRAKAHAERSGQLPLYIHVHGPTNSRFGTPDDLAPIKFIASDAARTGSLDLDTHYEYQDFHGQVLETCLKGCVPGVFTRLFVREGLGQGGPYYSRRIMAKDSRSVTNKDRAEPLLLDLPEQRLEDLLLGCTTLSLDGMLGDFRVISDDGDTLGVGSKAVVKKLRKLCPVVEFLDESVPKPMGSRY
ncbi:hypothetical protein B0J17DRAFT_629340 [Rhizoctonia solani]|nr:hypothetical protein B0J17DRAFT_629340 [Rhizoctonia solani]